MQLLWTVMPAPGPIRALTVGATSAGLALVAFGDHPEAAARAADRLGFPAVKKEPADAVAQLREYLAGERRVFDLPVDWSLTRGSQRRVLETLFATVATARP